MKLLLKTLFLLLVVILSLVLPPITVSYIATGNIL